MIDTHRYNSNGFGRESKSDHGFLDSLSKKKTSEPVPKYCFELRSREICQAGKIMTRIKVAPIPTPTFVAALQRVGPDRYLHSRY